MNALFKKGDRVKTNSFYYSEYLRRFGKEPKNKNFIGKVLDIQEVKTESGKVKYYIYNCSKNKSFNELFLEKVD